MTGDPDSKASTEDGDGLGIVRWDAQGLVPAIVQDATTGRVLMMAWMNREALALTLQTGQTHFWSRSRGSLWHKGATSGNLQVVRQVEVDCDGDAILVTADPMGPACHTGEVSCFHRPLLDGSPSAESAVLLPTPAPTGVLAALWGVIQDRLRVAPPGSYTAELFAGGVPRIAQKVGEEALETALAAVVEGDDRVVYEMADLVYHCLVLLAAKGLTWSAVETELARRSPRHDCE